MKAPRVYVPVVGVKANGTGVAYKPVALFLSGDGATEWDVRRWISYGGATAVATAEKQVNNCVPSCANGRHSFATTRIVFSGRVPCYGHLAYAEFTVTRTSRRSAAPVGSGIDLTSDCGYVAFRPGLACLVRDRAAVSTRQQKRCFDSALRRNDRKIARARATMLRSLALGPRDRRAFMQSEADWLRYRSTSCAAVASIYAGGTFEPILRDACLLDRDGAHLHDLAIRHPLAP